MELIGLRRQIDEALEKMRDEGKIYLIDDTPRRRERDTISSFWKVFPKGIEKQNGDYYATTPEAIKWVEDLAEKYHWELIEVITTIVKS